VAELARNVHRFTEKNITLAVIGSGDPVHFDPFREATGYRGLLFSDPELASFSLLGFANGLSGFLSMRSAFKAVSALKSGHRQGSIQGSALQLGGAVVVDSGGAIRYFFAAVKAGDHPDIDDLLLAAADDRVRAGEPGGRRSGPGTG
jgi:hypothetical protein